VRPHPPWMLGAFVVDSVVVIGGNFQSDREAVGHQALPPVGSPHRPLRCVLSALTQKNPTASGLRCRIPGRYGSGGSSHRIQRSRRSSVVADARETPADACAWRWRADGWAGPVTPWHPLTSVVSGQLGAANRVSDVRSAVVSPGVLRHIGSSALAQIGKESHHD
jgi:hypothetical protein